MIEDATINHMASGIADYTPRSEFGPRTSGDFELVWIIDGSATWQLHSPQEDEVSLSPGELLCCFPGERDAFLWDRNKVTRHGYIHFGLSNIPDSFRLPRLRSLRLGDSLPELLRYLTSAPCRDSAPALQHSLLRSCLHLMCDAERSKNQDSDEQLGHPLIRQLFQVIQEEWNLAGKLALISTAR